MDNTITIRKEDLDSQSTKIRELIDLMTVEGEIDFDELGAVLDSDTLEKAMDSFNKSYDLIELIERYLQFADKPIELEVSECQN